MPQHRTSRERVELGVLCFDTKQSAIKFVKQTIDDLGPCEISPQHDAFDLFMELLLRHPNAMEKQGAGIKQFNIERGGYSELTLRAVRVDGTDADFSWRKCIGKADHKAEKKLRNAMRYAVKNQIAEFRQSVRFQDDCGICGKKIETDEHIHHADPSFETLVQEFLKEAEMCPCKFGSCPETNSSVFLPEHESFSNSWAKYHQNNCNLQKAHKTCNLKASKKLAVGGKG